MVLRQSVQLAMAGCLLGALAVPGLLRIMARYIQRIDTFDAAAYAAGMLLVIFAAMAASWVPARRAVTIDPARTLHCD